MNKVDIAVILLAIFTAVNSVLLWLEAGALINQIGILYTTLGVYFSLRFLVRDRADTERVMRVFAYIAVITAILMTYETITGRNPVYAYLGGVRGATYQSVMERDGKLRATGFFSHPLLAGTFGAVSLPVFFALWFSAKKNRMVAVLGIVAATVITITSNGSTPVMAYAAALAGMALWPMRNRTGIIRWGIVIVLVSLHMIMTRPVWSLIARIDLTGIFFGLSSLSTFGSMYPTFFGLVAFWSEGYFQVGMGYVGGYGKPIRWYSRQLGTYPLNSFYFGVSFCLSIPTDCEEVC